ncbi:MAG: SMI1/KNR4 family protein [Deltaproteobacteria bacterium]|nr:SMI1/KNR4 family protein [Deltaproteobacteria bacterium]
MSFAPVALRDRLAATPGLTLHPALPEATVADLERRHGVTLPASYRRFLTEVAGGVDSDSVPLLGPDLALTTLTGAPGGVFPYDAAYAADLVARLAAVPATRFLDVMSAPAVQAGQHEGDPPGCIALADFGCGDYSVLVLTGPEAGKLWRIGDFDAPETAALYQPGAAGGQLEFDSWLPHWCELVGA